MTKSDKESERGVRKRESEKKRKGAGEEERGGERDRERELIVAIVPDRQRKQIYLFENDSVFYIFTVTMKI